MPGRRFGHPVVQALGFERGDPDTEALPAQAQVGDGDAAEDARLVARRDPRRHRPGRLDADLQAPVARRVGMVEMHAQHQTADLGVAGVPVAPKPWHGRKPEAGITC